MKLTLQDLHSIGNGGCGFNSAQLTLLGVTDVSRGWLKRLVGHEVADETMRLLCELRGASVARQKELVPHRDSVWARESKKNQPRHVVQIQECRAQFRRLLLCLRAGEQLSAQDHAREIVRLCGL